jgi:hypothetical protein
MLCGSSSGGGGGGGGGAWNPPQELPAMAVGGFSDCCIRTFCSISVEFGAVARSEATPPRAERKVVPAIRKMIALRSIEIPLELKKLFVVSLIIT